MVLSNSFRVTLFVHHCTQINVHIIYVKETMRIKEKKINEVD